MESVFDQDSIIFEFENKSNHVEDCKLLLPKIEIMRKREFIFDKLLRMRKPTIEKALRQRESFFEKQITKLSSTANPSWDHEAKGFKLEVSLTEENIRFEGDGTYTVKVRNSARVRKICEELKEKFESQTEYVYLLRYQGKSLENSKRFSECSIPEQATLEFRKFKRITNKQETKRSCSPLEVLLVIFFGWVVYKLGTSK